MEKYMRQALLEAEKAAAIGEVPIGAVIVKNDRIIAAGHNLTETHRDPTAHAEMNAIREAARRLGGWRLSGCSMFVTCEPCSMCAGAIVWSRIENLYIGTMDPKAGACGSVFDITGDPRLNHQVHVESGLLAEACSGILKTFFKDLRIRHRKDRETEDTQQ
ncbi:MAG: tRNA adenosine(34) deaminase TadA [Eubacteriales bacterium]|jgi:tRNA(adenine34) deaminase|nr:tRNA adenosine(34) deaminase TadA [Eubacteriales bacterium]